MSIQVRTIWRSGADTYHDAATLPEALRLAAERLDREDAKVVEIEDGGLHTPFHAERLPNGEWTTWST